MGPRRVDYPTARVGVTLRDGRVLEESTTLVRGDAAHPVASEEVVDKFLALTSPVLGVSRARQALEAARKFDALENLRDLTSLLGGA